jgi:hypothetical protein
MGKSRKTGVIVLLLSSIGLLYPQTARKPTAKAPLNRDQEIVNTVRKLEDDMRLASLKGNAGWWAEYLADGYTDTDFRGKVSSKAEIIEMQRSGDLSYDTLNLSDRAVLIFNGDTVIITGKLTADGAYRGQSLSGEYQITRVWIKTGSDWKLAASQATKIAS